MARLSADFVDAHHAVLADLGAQIARLQEQMDLELQGLRDVEAQRLMESGEAEPRWRSGDRVYVRSFKRHGYVQAVVPRLSGAGYDDDYYHPGWVGIDDLHADVDFSYVVRVDPSSVRGVQPGDRRFGFADLEDPRD